MAESPRAAGSRREARRGQLHELSRRQLLDAAETVFGDKGIHAATIKEIAELAEYSVGSVYSFFDSKDDLLVAVLARRGDEMVEGIRRATAAGGAPLDRLAALARFELAFFGERPAFARLYLRSSAIGDLLPEIARDRVLDDRYHEAMNRTAALLAEGQATGEVCEGDPHLLARVLSGIVTAFQAATLEHPGAAADADALDALVRRTFRRSPGAPDTSARPHRGKGPT